MWRFAVHKSREIRLVRGKRINITAAAAVHRYRISADREYSGPTHTAPRNRTAAAIAVRTQCLGWERFAQLYLLCSAISRMLVVVRSLFQQLLLYYYLAVSPTIYRKYWITWGFLSQSRRASSGVYFDADRSERQQSWR